MESGVEEGLRKAVETAVERALDYLSSRQLPDGEFPTLVFPTGDLAGPSEPDSTNFPTCLIAYSLGFCRGPRAAALALSARELLRSNLEGPGLLRYWTPKSPLHRYMPPDVDDTACASDVLRRGGQSVPPNRAALLANRTRGGLFYTWMLPVSLTRIRWGALVRVVRQVVFPLAHAVFWWRTPASPDDVDAAVNANVLAYLGEGPHAPPVVDYLVGTLEDGREAVADKWYQDPFSVYYFVARAYLEGIAGLARAGPLVVDRLLRATAEPATLTELQASQSVCAFLSFGSRGEHVEAIVRSILARQRPDGSWPAHPTYYGKRDYFWGSSELTTGFALEALARFLEG